MIKVARRALLKRAYSSIIFSYERLGHERDEDLVVLCWDCHEELHIRYGSRRWDLREKSYEFIDEKRQLHEMTSLLETI